MKTRLDMLLELHRISLSWLSDLDRVVSGGVFFTQAGPFAWSGTVYFGPSYRCTP